MRNYAFRNMAPVDLAQSIMNSTVLSADGSLSSMRKVLQSAGAGALTANMPKCDTRKRFMLLRLSRGANFGDRHCNVRGGWAILDF